MARKKEDLLRTIAELYYEDKKTQEEISKIIGISRSRISRLLNEAYDAGIVQIKVARPNERYPELEHELKTTFSLKDAVVIAVALDSSMVIRTSIGKATAKYIEGMVKDTDTLGVAWGRTLYEVAKYLNPDKNRKVNVVQIIGGLGSVAEGIHANELAREISNKFGGVCYYLHAPAIVESKQIRDALLNNKTISSNLDMGRKANIILVGIGALQKDSPIIQATRLSSEEIKALDKAGAVGDICGHFFNLYGEACPGPLQDRVIAVELEVLKKAESSIAVAGGKDKILPIIGALKGGYANILITDKQTAIEVVKKSKEIM